MKDSSIFTIFALTIIFAVGFILIKDGKISSRFFSSNSYEFELKNSLPEAGEMKVEALKDRPEVRLQKWNGEIDLGVSYENVSGKAEKGSDGKVIWKDPNDKAEEVHAYPIDPSISQKAGIGPDGGFEIEILLNNKPHTNKFDFKIDGYEDLDFLYQMPLNKEKPSFTNPNPSSCSETDCFDVNGKLLNHRPENVINSYAVYHKTKKDHIPGHTNYGSGKAFHIYRPKAIDASGKEKWAELRYKDGTLSVTVPQDFLETANYPIIIDPTFGYTSIGGSSAATAADTLIANRYNVSVSSNGTVDSVSHYCSGATTNIKAVVTNSSLNILTNGTGNTATCGASAGWVTATYTTKPSVSSGNSYYPSVVFNNASGLAYYDAGGATDTAYDSSNSYASPTNPTDAIDFATRFSLYATYTADPPPPSPTPALMGVTTRGGGSGSASNVKVRGGGIGSIKFRGGISSASSGASANMQVVQSKACSSGASTGDFACTGLTPTTAGNLLVVFQHDGDTTSAPSVPTSSDGTWQQACTFSGLGARFSVFYLPSATGGNTSYTVRPASGHTASTFYEVSGAAASPLDVCSSAENQYTYGAGAGERLVSAHITSTQDGLAFGWTRNEVSSSRSYAADTGWTGLDAPQASDANDFMSEYLTILNGVRGQYISSFTAVSGSYTSGAVVFKGANTGSAPSGVSPTFYSNFETGNNGDTLTPTVMQSATKGACQAWTGTTPQMTISTSAQQSLHSNVTVNGVTYADSGSTRGVKYDNGEGTNSYQLCTFADSTSSFTVSGYVLFHGLAAFGDRISFMTIGGAGAADYAAAQVYNGSVLLETLGGDSSTYSVSYDHWYYFSINYVAGGTHSLKIYDTTDWSLLSTLTHAATGTNNPVSYSFGNSHNDITHTSGAYLYFDNIVADATGTFPLGP